MIWGLLGRYQIDAIELQPALWQAPFELTVLNVNLKNACVEFINAIFVSMLAMIIIRLCKINVPYWKCLSATLYGYALFILINAIYNSLALAFFTGVEFAPPNVTTTTMGNGWFNTTKNFTTYAFDGERLYLPVAQQFQDLFSGINIYLISSVQALFNTYGLIGSQFNVSKELLLIIPLLDFKIIFCVMLMRIKWWASLVAIIFCSSSGYYVDAFVSRYTAKHENIVYISTRMHPTVRLGQAFKYSTTYFDVFPMKTGDLALIDYWQCKWSRHLENRRGAGGAAYMSGSSISFDVTITRCDQAERSLLSPLAPEYEIVRILAVAGQTFDVSRDGSIKIDGSAIAKEVEREAANFTLLGSSQVIEGQHIIHEYQHATQPHEPQESAYYWECSTCNSDSLIGGIQVVPNDFVLAMFDYMARPRFMVVKKSDIIGFPFVRAKQRW